MERNKEKREKIDKFNSLKSSILNDLDKTLNLKEKVKQSSYKGYIAKN